MEYVQGYCTSVLGDRHDQIASALTRAHRDRTRHHILCDSSVDYIVREYERLTPFHLQDIHTEVESSVH